jgi:hypothetical protein
VGGNATHDLISGKCRECPERLPVQQPFEIGIAELFSFLVESAIRKNKCLARSTSPDVSRLVRISSISSFASVSFVPSL